MALSAEEIQALMGGEQPTTITPSAPEESGGLVSTLIQPFQETGKFAGESLARLFASPENRQFIPRPEVPLTSLLTIAGLINPATSAATAAGLATTGLAKELGFTGLPATVAGFVGGGLRGIPAGQKLAKGVLNILLGTKFGKTAATKTPEIAEALGMTAAETTPTIEAAMKGAADLAKGRMGAELIQPVAAAGPASVSTATAGSQEASKFIDMIYRRPDLRLETFQPGVLERTMQTVTPLFQKGESAENVFTQLYGRGAIAKEAVTTATSRASEFTKFMDMASGQIQAGADKQKIQQAASALAQQGQKAEDIFKAIFGREAPGVSTIQRAATTTLFPPTEEQKILEFGRTLGVKSPFGSGAR